MTLSNSMLQPLRRPPGVWRRRVAVAMVAWVVCGPVALSAPASLELLKFLREIRSGRKAQRAMIKDGRGRVRVDMIRGKVLVQPKKGQRRARKPNGEPIWEYRHFTEQTGPREMMEAKFWFKGDKKFAGEVVRRRRAVLREGQTEPEIEEWSWKADKKLQRYAADGKKFCMYEVLPGGRPSGQVYIYPAIAGLQDVYWVFRPFEVSFYRPSICSFITPGRIMKWEQRKDGLLFCRLVYLRKADWYTEDEVLFDPNRAYGLVDFKAFVNTHLRTHNTYRLKLWNDGMCFPERIESLVMDRGRLFRNPVARLRERVTWTISELEFNVGVPDSRFTLDGMGIPEGTTIVDQRHRPPVVFPYQRRLTLESDAGTKEKKGGRAQ